MGKTDVRAEILQMVLKLEITKGHLKWKVSDLARLTKASRPLVYYHFGKTKLEILIRCTQIIAEEHYGLNLPEGFVFTAEVAIESLMKRRQTILKNPALAVFYQKWRIQPSPIQDQLIQIEKRYQAKLRKALPHLSAPQIIALHGIFHGLLTAPFMTNDALKEAGGLVTKFFGPTAVGN